MGRGIGAVVSGALVGLVVLAGCACKRHESEAAGTGRAAPADERYILRYTMKTIDGEEQDLSAYEGKVLLVVNVASKCGLTPQYEGLEALYREHKDEGLVVLGFPANDFNGQEPGTEAEIRQFCTANYGVTFPMFSKISVKGAGAHPLYRQLAELPPPAGGEPSWNFTKYLVDRDGNVVMRFDPRTKPDDPALVAAVEAELGS